MLLFLKTVLLLSYRLSLVFYFRSIIYLVRITKYKDFSIQFLYLSIDLLYLIRDCDVSKKISKIFHSLWNWPGGSTSQQSSVKFLIVITILLLLLNKIAKLLWFTHLRLQYFLIIYIKIIIDKNDLGEIIKLNLTRIANF